MFDWMMLMLVVGLVVLLAGPLTFAGMVFGESFVAPLARHWANALLLQVGRGRVLMEGTVEILDPEAGTTIYRIRMPVRDIERMVSNFPGFTATEGEGKEARPCRELVAARQPADG